MNTFSENTARHLRAVCSAVLLGAGMMGLSQPASAFLIDNFNDDENAIIDTDIGGPKPAILGTVLSGANSDLPAGATRDITVDKTAGVSGASRVVIAEIVGGFYSLAFGPQTNGVGEIIYNFASTDFSAIGNPLALGVGIDSLDPGSVGPVDISMTLKDSSGDTQTITNSFVADVNNAVSVYNFSSAGNFDLADITMLTLVIDGSALNAAATDLTLAFIESVPEPATLGILGVSLLAAGAARRRRTASRLSSR